MVVSRRDIPGKAGKVFGISMEASTLVAYVKDKLDEIQSSLLEKAISFRDRYSFCLFFSQNLVPNFFCGCNSKHSHFDVNVQ